MTLRSYPLTLFKKKKKKEIIYTREGVDCFFSKENENNNGCCCSLSSCKININFNFQQQTKIKIVKKEGQNDDAWKKNFRP